MNARQIAALWLAGLVGVCAVSPAAAAAQSMAQRQRVSPQAVQSVQAQQYGLRCVTPRFWCGLQQPAPVGTACYCNTPSGPIAGRVSQ